MKENEPQFEYKTDILQKWHLIIGVILLIFLIPAGFYFSIISLIIAILFYAIFLIILFSFIIKEITFLTDRIEVKYPYSILKNNRTIFFNEIKEIKYIRGGFRIRAHLNIYLLKKPNLKIYGIYNKFKDLLNKLNKKDVKISSVDLITGWEMEYKEDINPDDEEDFQVKLY